MYHDVQRLDRWNVMPATSEVYLQFPTLPTINAMDNIMVEHLWRSVKYEEIYLKVYQNMDELKQSLKDYFDFYNYERPHSTYGGKKPAEIFGITNLFQESHLRMLPHSSCHN